MGINYFNEPLLQMRNLGPEKWVLGPQIRQPWRRDRRDLGFTDCLLFCTFETSMITATDSGGN